MSVSAAVAAADKAGIRPIEILLYQAAYGHQKAVEARREFELSEREIHDLTTQCGEVAADKLALWEKRFAQMKHWFALAADRAEKAAPYIHPKIASLAVQVSDENSVEVRRTIDVLAAMLDKRAAEIIDAEPVTVSQAIQPVE